MTIGNTITNLSSQIREIESKERHGLITSETANELMQEITSQIYEILDNKKHMAKNIGIVADDMRNNLCYVQGTHLNRYANGDFDTQEGLRIMLAHVDQEVLEIISNQNIIDNQVIFQQILMGNIIKVEDIVK